MTEAEAGRIRAASRTSATQVDDGWRIDGEKWFVTVGDVADYLIVLAIAMTGGDTRPIFLVDKDLPGVQSGTRRRYMHTSVFDHPQFGFEGVRVVPDDAILGEVGAASS